MDPTQDLEALLAHVTQMRLIKQNFLLERLN
jgi:hypothetical protein